MRVIESIVFVSAVVHVALAFETWSLFPRSEYIKERKNHKHDEFISHPYLYGEEFYRRLDRETVSVGLVATTTKKFTFMKNDFEINTFRNDPDIMTLLERVRIDGLCGIRSGLGTTNPLDLLKMVLGFYPPEKGCAVDSLSAKLKLPFSAMPSFKGTYTAYVEATGFGVHKGSPDAGHLHGSGVAFDRTTSMFHGDQQNGRDPLGGGGGRPTIDLLEALGVSFLLRFPAFQVVNVWVALSDVEVRPLAVLDNGDRRASPRLYLHTESKSISTPSFASDDEKQEFDADVWMMRYDDALNDAEDPAIWVPNYEKGDFVAFSTTRSFHTAVSLPGEAELALYFAVFANAVNQGNSTLNEACEAFRTSKVKRDLDASQKMSALLDESQFVATETCRGALDVDRIQELKRRATRHSLAFRVVCFVLPYEWLIALTGIVYLLSSYVVGRR